ncbi:MAG: hypothetical protein ACLSHP_05665 [Coprococcus sp.]
MNLARKGIKTFSKNPTTLMYTNTDLRFSSSTAENNGDGKINCI